MKNIINKIKEVGKKNLALGGLVASSLWICGNTGCQTMNNNAMNSPAVQGLGWSIINTYAQESIKAEVNPNQTEINVNMQQPQNGNQGSQVQYQPAREKTLSEIFTEMYNSGKDLTFTCNFYRDLNRNNSTEIDEFFGIKSVFDRNEKITTVYITSKNLSGKVLSREILNGNGGMVSLKRKIVGNYNDGIAAKFVIDEGTLVPGSYSAIFSTPEEYLGKTEFKVVE